jgi:cytochrome P450
MVMTAPSVFAQVLDHANRADPYPLYAELRKTPVARQDDGSYVVSTYREIVDLLHDPRISSDPSSLAGAAGDAVEGPPGVPPPFLSTDPPEHDRVRRIFNRHFGPPHTPGRIDGMIPDLRGIVTGLIDGLAGRTEIDIVDDFAYPVPVTAICDLLGVPREDEPRFHGWAQAIVDTIDPGAADPAEPRPTASPPGPTCSPGWSPTTAPRGA